MKTYTIPQKQSHTGSIHDAASEHHDREIKFPKGKLYAVIRAAYYSEYTRENIYTTHQTEEAAAKESRKLSTENISHEIIDPEGNRYFVNWDHLVKTGQREKMNASILELEHISIAGKPGIKVVVRHATADLRAECDRLGMLPDSMISRSIVLFSPTALDSILELLKKFFKS